MQKMPYNQNNMKPVDFGPRLNEVLKEPSSTSQQFDPSAVTFVHLVIREEHSYAAKSTWMQEDTNVKSADLMQEIQLPTSCLNRLTFQPQMKFPVLRTYGKKEGPVQYPKSQPTGLQNCLVRSNTNDISESQAKCTGNTSVLSVRNNTTKQTKKHLSKVMSSDKHICALCRRPYLSQYSLMKHVFSHVLAVNNPQHTCVCCTKVFQSSKHLQFHKCRNNFSKSSLKRHSKIQWSEELFYCEICGKTYTNVRTFKNHVKMHITEKLFTCGECGKTFNHSGTFTLHQRIHSGERPFACNICQKTFTQSAHFKAHQKIHSGERPLVCDVCGKTFTSYASLNNHQRIHLTKREYICDVCGKMFVLPGALKTHKMIHSGERPFVCDKCGKTFYTSSNLICHRRIHTGEKLFACEICGKAFTQAGTLKRHVAIH